jgi:hypothetical protein
MAAELGVAGLTIPEQWGGACRSSKPALSSGVRCRPEQEGDLHKMTGADPFFLAVVDRS